MKRVLIAGVGETVFGGVEKICLDIYRNIDKNKVQYDFLSPNKTTYISYEKEIENMGGKIIEFHTSRKSIKGRIAFMRKLNKYLRENEYDVVHINSGSFFFCLDMSFVCKIRRIKKVIVHSHSNRPQNFLKQMLINVLKPLIVFNATDYFACSKEAAKALFTKSFIKKGKVRIIKNGIDVPHFSFNEKTRKEYRKELKIEGKNVYGFVGRMDYQKNPLFLIDIFNEIQKIDNSAVLLFVGNGPLKDDIYSRVDEYNIKNKIIFLDFRKDVSELFQAMDCFIFPSLYEGLGIVAIEAQTTGLLTICSDIVPTEANISKYFVTVGLDKSPKEWANKICSYNFKELNKNRKEAYKYTLKSGYDIKTVSKEIEKLYGVD